MSSNITDGSSANSAVFNYPTEPGNNAFAIQLYREISALEGKILKDEADDRLDDGRVVVQGCGKEVTNGSRGSEVE